MGININHATYRWSEFIGADGGWPQRQRVLHYVAGDVRERNPELADVTDARAIDWAVANVKLEDIDPGEDLERYHAYLPVLMTERRLLRDIEKLVDEHPDRRNPYRSSTGCLYKSEADDTRCVIGTLLVDVYRYEYDESWETKTAAQLMPKGMGFSDKIGHFAGWVQGFFDQADADDTSRRPVTWSAAWSDLRGDYMSAISDNFTGDRVKPD